MKSIKILGTGIYLPRKIVTNEDLAKIVETNDEWIQSRTGIKERRVSHGEPTWLISLKAARLAIENAKIKVEDIDLIISTSVTPDYLYPSVSCVVQGKLGAKNAIGIDINCACAGYIYALDMAAKYLSTGYNTVLIISGENITKTLDYKDRSTCVLLGDGAGASVVQAKDGVYASHLGTDGNGAKHLFSRGVPIQNIFTPSVKLQEYDGFEKTEGNKIFMEGQEVYKFATRAMASSVKEACKKAGVKTEDISMVVPHQANLRIVETAAVKLKMPMSKFFVNIEKYGNTSSASVSICMHELRESKKIQCGELICCVGFGAGLTYGAVIFEY